MNVHVHVHNDPLQERFRNPLWADVDRLAEYLQEAFETVKAMRAGVPAAHHAQANRDLTGYVALLVLFTSAAVFGYGTARTFSSSGCTGFGDCWDHGAHPASRAVV
jgi:hypothetical protein